MIASRVVREAEVIERLKKLGFTKTSKANEVGTFWRSKTGRHLLVTHSVQGFYPDWLLNDIDERLHKLNLPSLARF